MPLDLPDLTKLQRDTFGYFLHKSNEQNGLVADNTRDGAACSIAATGLALAAYTVAAEAGWIDRADAIGRTLKTLRFFRDSPQGSGSRETGYKGFYYHFLNMEDGRRAGDSELSTIDSAFLLAGFLTAGTYFDGDDSTEREIREIADSLYRRADWQWALYGVADQAGGWPTENRDEVTIVHGGTPENGFISHRYAGYDESLLMHILALGSPTHPLPPGAYSAWQRTFEWRELYGIEYLHAGPLFIHQLSHCWVDFRGIADGFMRGKGIDYFENSRRAVEVQRRYCAENPNGFRGYDQWTWGITASGGPGPAKQVVDGVEREFFNYLARGVPDGPDDGTLSPWAVVASLPFAPEAVRETIKRLDENHPEMVSEWGFHCSFNPTFDAESNEGRGWVAGGYYGLDQGPIVLMLENERSGFLWDLMKRCPYIRTGLAACGFAGGWLDEADDSQDVLPASGADAGQPDPNDAPPLNAPGTMRAARVFRYGDAPRVVGACRPTPGEGQVLIRVRAAGVNPLDWQSADGKVRGWLDPDLPQTVGREVAGVIESCGKGAAKFAPGDAVYAMTGLADGGADAEFALAAESAVARKPESLDFNAAAAVPVGALTAWAALFDVAELKKGQRVLIHAAAGGVGHLAVQLAKHRGATVIGTASADHADFLRDLGCDEVIDHTAEKFEDVIEKVDVVLDPLGGDVQARSYAVLKPGGILVALTDEPDAPAGVRAAFIGARPDGERLAEIATLVDAGALRPRVQNTMPLQEIADALKVSRAGHVAGKLVLTL